jgi:exopolysaccharide biosynthesis polyprenyl glycosylphosphotransferase
LSPVQKESVAPKPADTIIQVPPPHYSKTGTFLTRLWSNRSFVVVTRLLSDAVLLIASFLLAYAMRYQFNIGVEFTEKNYVYLPEYYPLIALYAASFLLVLYIRSYYKLKRQATLLDEVGIIINGALVTTAVLAITIFVVSRVNEYSRLMFVFLVPLSILFLAINRSVTRWVRKQFWLRGIGARNVLVIGATDVASRLMGSVVENPNLGFRLVGYIDDETRFSEWILPNRYRNGDPVPHLGKLERLEELITEQKINEVMITLPASLYNIINDVIARCRESNVDYQLVPDLFELRLDSYSLIEIKGVPLIGLKKNNLRGWNYFMKRVLDVTLSGGALIVLSPLILLIALTIKLDSPGPIIYRQKRIGKNGQLFTFYKFRSMRIDADQKYRELLAFNETGGATFKMKNDPRRTRIGKFIRRTSLDEIPQFFNILLGQMSFVGPRPTIDREISQYQAWHKRRLEVTPGLTGLWQVSGRSKIPFEDMVKLDIYYAENWSLWLDIKILLRTIPAVIRGDGAY